MKLHIFKTPEDLATSFADQMMNWIENSNKEIFHLALSGGKTPDLLFSVLAEKYRNSKVWQKTHFWWVDERMVLPDNPESNFGNAWKLLLSHISIPKENIHRIEGENSPESEAISYASEISNRLIKIDGWPAFDLIILGMGDDGHTASIFPDQLHLLNSENSCEVATHPVTAQKRVTLTGRIINNANKICFLVTGAGKAQALAEIKNDSKMGNLLPAKQIIPVNGELHWYVDQFAVQLVL
jgi:6-phosphogluconolactonase